jgi:hypothetical protein
MYYADDFDEDAASEKRTEASPLPNTMYYADDFDEEAAAVSE